MCHKILGSYIRKPAQRLSSATTHIFYLQRCRQQKISDTAQQYVTKLPTNPRSNCACHDNEENVNCSLRDQDFVTAAKTEHLGRKSLQPYMSKASLPLSGWLGIAMSDGSDDSRQAGP